MTLIEIKYGSNEYEKMLELRREILRRPLGLNFQEDELLSEREDILLAAFNGGELIACCILSDQGLNKIKLRQMAVRKNLQKKGIGRALLLFAEKTARQKRFQTITLHARIKAKGFYEKNGYNILGEVFEEVGIPHICMQKDLN